MRKLSTEKRAMILSALVDVWTWVALDADSKLCISYLPLYCLS